MGSDGLVGGVIVFLLRLVGFYYVPLLFASICFNYWIGGQIRDGVGRKGWLIVGIVGNLDLLGYFKYTGFFLSTVNFVGGCEENSVNKAFYDD